MTQSRVRFGILGFGHHAVRRLLPGFAKCTEATLTGMWRRDQAAAGQNCAEYKIPHCFPTREALCSSPDVDVVFITSPDAKAYRLGFSAYNPLRFRQSYKWHIDIAGVAKVPFELARLLRASFVPVVLDPTERDNHHISIWFHQFLPRASRSGRAAISSPPP